MGRVLVLSPVLLLILGCTSNPDRRTIAQLRDVDPDLAEVHVDDSLVKALSGYQQFLNDSPEHVMAPEAMRRMADLHIEREHGVLGGDREVSAMAAPRSAERGSGTMSITDAIDTASGALGAPEGNIAFEDRAAAPDQISERSVDLALPDGSGAPDHSGPAQAIATYKKILSEYPWYERNDQVLYQMARAYDELAQPDEAIRVTERLLAEYPDSRYASEVYFRRGEYYFVRRNYLDAETSYLAVVERGEVSEFYELALYKLGWSMYKQELYEEALNHYIALLDYKRSKGYDFDAADGIAAAEDGDQAHEERRVADTFRVISLSFSNLGGPEVLREYFGANGHRDFEDRIYSNLAEFHFDKRRFNDAAEVYKGFVQLNPVHVSAPHFSMRVAEIYAAGNFPLLVVESKKDFATRYGVDAPYWQHFELEARPEVRDYLKQNLIDLANHYHALYQEATLEDEQPRNYAEALRWYDEFLASFPSDDDSPAINYQLADLLLEHDDFDKAALEYERTAYEYPEHERASEAGYAAIYAHRQHLEATDGEAEGRARLATVESSLRFAGTFPDHLQAATVLGAATEDLYAMEDLQRALASGRWLIDRYPEAELPLRRMAWMIVAHACFDLETYSDAEAAYGQVLTLTDPDGEDRQAVIDNLAAAIYQQGEQALEVEDYLAAADHFLRIKTVAPASGIRAAAEYDAAAALVRVEQWTAAAEVLEDFRASHPEHELNAQATKQLAVAYEEAGDLSRSAAEYERVADEAEDQDVRSEALLVAGDLYDQADSDSDALRLYERYVAEYPQPVELALEIRNKVAGIHDQEGNRSAYLTTLRTMVEIEAEAGAARTDRTRYLAATSALILTRPIFDEFNALRLVQPFQQSLEAKQRLMDQALGEFEALVDYEVAEVTAAATYYIAQLYRSFSDALVESERPAELGEAELAEYELVIEEEAYPFEEQAIAVHRENLELMRLGVFNRWIQLSLDELAVLMPGRYAKAEISSGYVGTIDEYAYRSPVAPNDPLSGNAELSSRDEATGDAPADLAGVSDAGR